MEIVYNELSSTCSDEIFNGFYHILVVVEGLCFYCSGQHCVLVFVMKISLRMCGIKHKDCVSESILFLNV